MLFILGSVLKVDWTELLIPAIKVASPFSKALKGLFILILMMSLTFCKSTKLLLDVWLASNSVVKTAMLLFALFLFLPNPNTQVQLIPFQILTRSSCIAMLTVFPISDFVVFCLVFKIAVAKIESKSKCMIGKYVIVLTHWQFLFQRILEVPRLPSANFWRILDYNQQRLLQFRGFARKVRNW